MVEMRNAPTGENGGETVGSATQLANTHCTATTGEHVSAHPHLPAVPAYLLIVEVRGEKYQRRPYMSLSSAEKAVERARSQGRYATVRLVACTPVPGGDLA